MNAPQPASPPAPHIDYLDGWRGLAILLVLQSHFLPVKAWHSGALGVNIFFVLSGWLMAGLLFVRREPLRRFYKRRFSRIVPGFVAFVAAIYLLSGAVGEWPGLDDFFASLFFLRTYLPTNAAIWDSLVPIGHLWSLNAEEHGYVLMSLVTVLPWARGRAHAVLIATGLIGLFIAFVYVKAGDRAPTWGNLGTEIAIAPLMLSAGYRLLLERRPPPQAAWISPMAVALAGLCHLTAAPWPAEPFVAPVLLAIAMNHLPQAGAWLKRALSLPWLRLCGVYSFSLYLWQQPFYKAKDWLPLDGASGLVFAAMAAWCSFRLIEQPCRETLNRRW